MVSFPIRSVAGCEYSILDALYRSGWPQVVLLLPEAALSLADILAVERQDFESFAAINAHRAKMPLIQAQYRVDAMSFR